MRWLRDKRGCKAEACDNMRRNNQPANDRQTGEEAEAESRGQQAEASTRQARVTD